MEKVLFKEQKSRKSAAQSGEISSKLNVLIGVGLAVLSIFLVFNSIRSFQIAREKLDILERAEKEVTDLRLKNISLILEKDKIETDDFTETDIRNRLNYSKNREIIFVIPDEVLSLAQDEVARILKKEEEPERTFEVWEAWVEMFRNGI